MAEKREALVRSLAELEDRLARPSAALVEDLRKLDGDLVILGAGGKLGPSLVRLALRGLGEAGSGAAVFAVSRFSRPGLADQLAAEGARVVNADVADEESRLPDAANVVFLVGSKFGTVGQEAATWATNTYLPGRMAQRYRGSRIVALSTGNVYPLTPVGGGGPTEEAPVGPVGEYAMSCLGRERVFTHFSSRYQTPLALIRLNYAVEMRYGVLVDLAGAVNEGREIDLTTGHANVVWQGYANEVTLRSLLHASADPPFVLNVTGPETISIRQVAERFAGLLGKPARFTGSEAPTSLLSNAQKCHGLFGYPDLPVAALIERTAAWIQAGLPLLGKPTQFQRRDGKF
jgi:nucleoside-diphosphate-sugar epimerase